MIPCILAGECIWVYLIDLGSRNDDRAARHRDRESLREAARRMGFIRLPPRLSADRSLRRGSARRRGLALAGSKSGADVTNVTTRFGLLMVLPSATIEAWEGLGLKSSLPRPGGSALPE